MTVTCRYFTREQVPEAWQQTLQRAARAAVTLGFSHMQVLSVDMRPELARSASVHCNAGFGRWDCYDKEGLGIATAWIAVNQFALISPEEAEARNNDPFVPADRKPLDARQLLAGGRSPLAPASIRAPR